jgi:hypothetical protein
MIAVDIDNSFHVQFDTFIKIAMDQNMIEMKADMNRATTTKIWAIVDMVSPLEICLAVQKSPK